IAAEASDPAHRFDLRALHERTPELLEQRLDPGDDQEPRMLRQSREEELEARASVRQVRFDQPIRIKQRAAVNEQRALLRHGRSILATGLGNLDRVVYG